MLQLNFYAIIDGIEKIRVARNMTQKELIKDLIDQSTYSKYKSKKLTINLQDAYILLERLNAKMIDLEDTYFFETKRNTIIQDTYLSIINEKDPDIEKINAFYTEIEKIKDTNGEILRYYLLLKVYYSKISDTITEIQPSDITPIYERLNKSTILTSIDYKLLADLTHYFSIDQLKSLVSRIIVKDLKSFSGKADVFLTFIPNTISNMTDIFIDNQEFDQAKILLTNLEEIAIETNNFFLMTMHDFLTYRLKFLKETNKKKQKKILKEFETWLKYTKKTHGKLPAYKNLEQSFKNLKNNVFEVQIITRKT